ncbi:MAG: hypothetical protein O2820_04170 [Planctomycetota bacterium]|nr:hypothetical protein [Planctomycetota bacterium]MDA1248400.1 hypothetical protein [Planctomycetota bacterium]
MPNITKNGLAEPFIPPREEDVMVAIASPTLKAAPRESNPWRVVKRCQTVEEARAKLAELRSAGIESSLLMDAGITVVAHR